MLRGLARLVTAFVVTAGVVFGTVGAANAASCVDCNYIGPILNTAYGRLSMNTVVLKDAGGNGYAVTVGFISHDLITKSDPDVHNGRTTKVSLAFSGYATDGRFGTFYSNHITSTAYGDVSWGTHLVWDEHYGCIGRWGAYNWAVQQFYPNPDGWHSCA